MAPAARTPGKASRRAVSCWKKAAGRPLTSKASTESERKPGCTACTRKKLRTMRPAAVSNTTASAPSAPQGQQKTLGEKLTDQASTSGAQSSADRQLLLSRHSAGKQQIGHIDTGDDQQQPDRNEENQQSLLRLSPQLFSQ